MKNIVNKSMNTVVIVLICMFLLGDTSVLASETKVEEISIRYYVMLLEKVLGEKSLEPMKTGIDIGLIMSSEFLNEKESISVEQAAVLTNRADIILNGEKGLDEKKYKRAIHNGRISDIGTVSKENRSAVYQVFVKGIMVGESNGMYSQNRKFSGSKKLSRKDAFVIVKRLEDIKKRKKMSPDGQVIRTTNLPQNYKKFDYILEAFPNSFYEMKFEFQREKLPFTPREFIEYTYPNRIKNMPYVNSEIGTGTVQQHQEMIDNYLDEWCQQIQKNLYYRLNVNYKTIDNKWLNYLRSTYMIYGIPDLDKSKTQGIISYINKVKQNRIVIETSKIVVEPSTLYYDTSGYKVRCYVKFRLVSTSIKNYTSDALLYCAFTNVTGFVKGKWVERYIDVEVSPVSNNSYGEGYYVTNDFLLEYKDSIVE